jgi:hypothetical protein
MSKWEPQKIRLGVSSSLLDETVRYDGGHKRDAFLTETLGPVVTWVPHHVRRFGLAYLADQVYLDPHPKELMLRNHV